MLTLYREDGQLQRLPGVAAGGGHSCGVLSQMTGKFSKEAKAFMVIKIIHEVSLGRVHSTFPSSMSSWSPSLQEKQTRSAIVRKELQVLETFYHRCLHSDPSTCALRVQLVLQTQVKCTVKSSATVEDVRHGWMIFAMQYHFLGLCSRRLAS